MPRSPSPVRGPRRRSPSPRRDHDRDRYRSRSPDRSGAPTRRERDRSRSPGRSGAGAAPPRRPKELSFYKKSGSSSMGSLSQRRDPLDGDGETARERMERRERGEIPGRFGGTREQGVRNTMSSVAPQGSGGQSSGGMGSFRRGDDPLERMPVRGAGGNGGPSEGSERREESFGSQREYDRRQAERSRDSRRDGDKAREARMAAMDKPAAAAVAVPKAAGRFIEVIANDRMGRKVRVKCLPTDTVGDLKKLIAAQTGTTAGKIQLKKWYGSFKDHVTLRDYEINDGMSLEMY